MSSRNFMIGDRVKVVHICEGSDSEANEYLGKTATVTGFGQYLSNERDICFGSVLLFDDGSFNGTDRGRWVWADEELELIERTTMECD